MTLKEELNFEYDKRVLAAIRDGANTARLLNEKVGTMQDWFNGGHNRQIDNSLRRLKKNRLITYDYIRGAWSPVVSMEREVKP